MTGQQIVGRTGVVRTAVRGGEKPGEARIVVEGIPHYYIAYCAVPLAAGAAILVINNRGRRCVDVEPWTVSTIGANEFPSKKKAI